MFPGIGFYLGRASCSVDDIRNAFTTAYLIAMLTKSVTILDFLGVGHKLQFRLLLQSPYYPRPLTLDGRSP